MLSYFTVVKLSLRLLTEAEAGLTKRLQIAVSLSAKAMTARAISLRAGASGGTEMDAEQREAVSRAMQTDVMGGDVVGALELYRSAIARAVAADNWTWPVSAAGVECNRNAF